MSDGNKPICKIVFKYKDGDSKNYEVGTIWPSTTRDGELLEGLGQLRPVSMEEEDLKAQYPKMGLRRALKLWEERKGYLNVWLNAGPKEDGRKMPSGKKGGNQDKFEFDDDDIDTDDLPY